MDALKCEKENKNVFYCNGIAQRTSEVCGISRRQIFNIKKEAASAGGLHLYLK